MDGAAQDRRPLGATGLCVSGLGMGCAKLGAFWQGRSPQAGRRAIDEARHSGINFFDTADCYARGLSERILGRALKYQRDDVVIATKVGMVKTPVALAWARRAEPGRPLGMAELTGMAPRATSTQCFAPGYVETATEHSLRRLATDRVELLLLHGPSVEIVRAQAFLPAVDRLRAAGKVRFFGVSCATEEQALAALEVPGVTCVQVPHNLSRAGPLGAVVDEAQRRGIGLVAIAPFGDGTLLAAAERLGLATDSVARACLGYSLGTPGVAAVVVGMSSPEHVQANVRAAAAPLPATELDSIRRAVAEGVEPGC